MIVITLSVPEMMMASQVGAIRRITSMEEGYDKNKHCEKSDWATDIDGAAAEMAFAKYLNVYYDGANCSFKQPDVGTWQVRSTSHIEGHLIVRPNDRDLSSRYVLVVTTPPTYTIVGYKYCAGARTGQYWRADRNGWWVPQLDLVPM